MHWQPSSSCNPSSQWYKITAVTGCIEKLTVLSEINQVTIMWVRGYSEIQLNETAHRLARQGARTRPIGPAPFRPLSLSRFKSKIRNWIEKRKQTEWKVCEMYWTSQLVLEGPTDRYVQFISKLDRKHCRMLIGLLTRHISICNTCCTRWGEQRLPHAGDAVQKREHRYTFYVSARCWKR